MDMNAAISPLKTVRILVVLDNAADAEQLRPLIPGAPTCGVLITSRAPLHGLESVATIPVDVLPHEHAIELVGKLIGIQRLAAERPAADRLVTLCGRLPLALRISGAKLAARPRQKIAELVRRLDAEHSRLDVLKAGDLEVRASFALSYDGLPADRRQSFRLLSVLNVPDFTAWTAARLLGLGQDAADDILDQLVEAQLIEEWNRDVTDSPRFRYHDLLRVFAREKVALEDGPDTRANAIEAAVAAYLFLVRWADDGLRGISLRPSLVPDGEPVAGLTPPAEEPLDWFEAERAGLTTIAEQAYENDLWHAVVHLANGAMTFFELRAYWSEAHLCNDLALRAARRLGDSRAEAAVLLDLGIINRYEEKWEKAIESFLASLAIMRTNGDASGIAYAQLHLGDVYREQNKWSAAMACFDESLRLFRRLDDEHGRAHTLRSIGAIYREQSRWPEAMACFEECLPLFRSVGDRRGEGHAMRSMGAVLRERGDYSFALECLTTSLSIFHDLGDQHWEAYVLQQIGALYRKTEERALAVKCLTTAIEIFDQLKDPLCGAQALRVLGEIHLDDGDPEQAVPALTSALATFEQLEVLRGQAQVLCSLGIAATARGEPRTAADLLHRSTAIFTEVGDRSSAQHVEAMLRTLRPDVDR